MPRGQAMAILVEQGSRELVLGNPVPRPVGVNIGYLHIPKNKGRS